MTHERAVIAQLNRIEGMLARVLAKESLNMALNAQTLALLSEMDAASTAASVRIQAIVTASAANKLDSDAVEAALAKEIAFLKSLATNPDAPVPVAPPAVVVP